MVFTQEWREMRMMKPLIWTFLVIFVIGCQGEAPPPLDGEAATTPASAQSSPGLPTIVGDVVAEIMQTYPGEFTRQHLEKARRQVKAEFPSSSESFVDDVMRKRARLSHLTEHKRVVFHGEQAQPGR
jgi:hypothetical protein